MHTSIEAHIHTYKHANTHSHTQTQTRARLVTRDCVSCCRRALTMCDGGGDRPLLLCTHCEFCDPLIHSLVCCLRTRRPLLLCIGPSMSGSISIKHMNVIT